MLKWPERARAAIRKLFEPLQDIDIYVEDANDEAFYRCLFNCVAHDTAKIARVFALGGREAVISKARTYDHSLRRALFIIDGDLSWVKGEPAPNIVGLHRHEAYCIENLLMCEHAIATVLSQEIVSTPDEAQKKLAYQSWCNFIRPHMTELFAAFAAAHDIDETIPTVSQGVGVMCVKHKKTKNTELDPAKVKRAKERALVAAEAKASKAEVSARFEALRERINGLPNPLYAASGKDFLLPLLDFHIQTFGVRIRRKSLRVRLATSGDPTRFARLAASLSLATRGFA